MKFIKCLIILTTVCILSWLLPQLSRLINDEGTKNIFAHYSAIEKSFVVIDFDEVQEKLVRRNFKNDKHYSAYEFDSILPMFYYRQLFADGRMPTSIHGVEVTRKQLAEQSFFYRMSPRKKNVPKIPLYTLFESMSGRVDLQSPGDFFRLTDKIEFLYPENSTVNHLKSEKFNKLFHIKGFHFPAVLVAGNPSDRKPYDEGYFILDSNSHLFHLKMVNGKPFLANVNMPTTIHPVFIATQEPADRSFYAFVYDTNGDIYLLTTNNYAFQKIASPPYNIDIDNLQIMANPLYWNVSVLNKRGREMYALDTKTKKVVDSCSIKNPERRKNLYDYIFPFVLSFESYNSYFIWPKFLIKGGWAFLSNFVFLGILLLIFGIRKQRLKLYPIILVILAGIYGLLAYLILGKKKNK